MAGTNGSSTAMGADTLKNWNGNMNTLGRAWMTAQNQYSGAGGPVGPEASLDTPADVTAANTTGGTKATAPVNPMKASTVQPQPQAAVAATTSSPTTGGGTGLNYKYTNEHLDTAAKLETQLQLIMNTPFSFNAKNDPTYLAAVQQALEGAKDATRLTREQMNDRGLLNSDITTTQLAQIEQKAELAPLQLIPGLEQNAYSRYQQGIQNNYNLWNSELTAGQNDRSFTYENAYKKADYSGNYLDPEAKNLVDRIMSDKQSWGGASPDDRKKIAADAVAARSALTGMGYDASKFNPNVGLDQANKNAIGFGMETLQAKQFRIGSDQWQKTFDKQGTQFEENRTDSNKQFDITRKDTNAHFWASYGLQQSAEKLSRSTAKEAKTMQENTNRVLYQMMLQGINTPNDAAQWLDANKADIDPTKMDVGALRSAVNGMAAGKTPGSPGYDIYVKAVELAQKNPTYINADDEATAQKVIDDLYAKLSALKNPPPPVQPMSAKTRAQVDANHKVQWAER